MEHQATKPPKRSLHAKLAEAALEAGYVQKKGVNKEQGYAFAAYGDIAAEVNAAISKRGIAVTVYYKDVVTELRKTRAGADLYYVRVRGVLRLTDADTGEVEGTEGIGEGVDTGDKAANKATTAFLKNAWRACLSMSFGLDADTESPELDDRKSKPVAKAKASPRSTAGDLIAAIPPDLPADQVLRGSILLAELDKIDNARDLAAWYAAKRDEVNSLKKQIKEAVTHGYGRTKKRVEEMSENGN